MPQMSPMWWTSLMMMFIFSFMLLMSILYFNFNLINSYKTEITKNKMIWKW
nr:ATP synthase F0 subunit 8 [Dikraneura zlata]